MLTHLLLTSPFSDFSCTPRGWPIAISVESQFQIHWLFVPRIIQRSAKRLVRGCEKFVPALAYLFCLALPGSCLARFAYFLADLCSISVLEGLWLRYATLRNWPSGNLVCRWFASATSDHYITVSSDASSAVIGRPDFGDCVTLTESFNTSWVRKTNHMYTWVRNFQQEVAWTCQSEPETRLKCNLLLRKMYFRVTC